MSHPFHKVSGAGNDFIALLEPAQPPDAVTVRAWCRRGLSIGADGVFTIAREGAAVRMVHWNADGGRSELCLNGSRCAALLAFENGWCAPDAVLELRTDAGDVACSRTAENEIEMTLPWALPAVRRVMLDAETPRETPWTGHYLVVGVPHLVIDVGDETRLVTLDLPALAPALRAHPELGDGGANVNFVAYRDAHTALLRTWERGVEGETLACGTGAIASGMVAFETGALEPPARFQTAGGHLLTVGGDRRRATLRGDARWVASGEIHRGASDSLSTAPTAAATDGT